MARKVKKQAIQKTMTVAELRVLLAQKDAELRQCALYNQQWQVVAEGYKRQKGELLAIVEQLTADRDYWKAIAMGQVVIQ